jgi:hypothetical protein
MANFAPYQDVIPERTRALSPSPTTSPRPERQAQKQRQGSKTIGTASLQSPTSPTAPSTSFFAPDAGWNDGGYSDIVERSDGFGSGVDGGDVEEAGITGTGRRRGFGSGREDVDLFETRLGIRMDWEACLAYLALPPAGAVLLLVLEHKSDYVRYVHSPF